MKAKVQLPASPSPSMGASVCSTVLAVVHAVLEFQSCTLMFGLACDKPQSPRGTEIEQNTRGDSLLFVCLCVWFLEVKLDSTINTSVIETKTC